MFVAIIFIAIGVAILLNAIGLLTGSFWGVFWGIIFLAIGIRMIRRERCIVGDWKIWKSKIKEGLHGENCDCCHEEAKQTEKSRKQK